MHVKLTYLGDGTIDIDMSAQSVNGATVSIMLDILRKLGRTITVERLSPSGAPLQEPEVLKAR